MGWSLKNNKIVKASAHINADGTILNNEGDNKFGDFSGFLQKLHQNTKCDIPTVHLSWEEGSHKYTIGINGVEYKSDAFHDVQIQAAVAMVQQLPIAEQNAAKLETINSHKFMYNFDKIAQEIQGSCNTPAADTTEL